MTLAPLAELRPPPSRASGEPALRLHEMTKRFKVRRGLRDTLRHPTRQLSGEGLGEIGKAHRSEIVTRLLLHLFGTKLAPVLPQIQPKADVLQHA